MDHCWQGKSALLCAIDSGSWDLVVSILNRSQIDLNRDYKTEEGWTPLVVACRHGHAGLVDLLINRGEDLVQLVHRNALLLGVLHLHCNFRS